MSAGRPSSFTQEIADAICHGLMEGRSLRSICTDDGMPTRATVFNWLHGNSAFFDQYARAREVQAEIWADEINDIADDSTNDYVTRTKRDGSEYEEFNAEAVMRARLRVDSRKWLLSKLLPKKYGDKVQAEVSGKDGGPVVFTLSKIGGDVTNQSNSGND